MNTLEKTITNTQITEVKVTMPHCEKKSVIVRLALAAIALLAIATTVQPLSHSPLLRGTSLVLKNQTTCEKLVWLFSLEDNGHPFDALLHKDQQAHLECTIVTDKKPTEEKSSPIAEKLLFCAPLTSKQKKQIGLLKGSMAMALKTRDDLCFTLQSAENPYKVQ
jgi:hypothetical protein